MHDKMYANVFKRSVLCTEHSVYVCVPYKCVCVPY
jgi:hypothetical protein